MTADTDKSAVPQSESDTNLTSRRSAWQSDNLDDTARRMLHEDAECFLHQSVSTPCLNAVVKAEGLWIEDTAGRRYMDFHGNNVHHIGYGHPRLVQAITEQMQTLSFAPRRYASQTAIDLARKIGQITPGNLTKVLFTTGGSDAVEVAVKIARSVTGRFKTLSFWDAFHGAGLGASSLSGEALFRSGPAASLMPGAEHIAPFACYHCPYGHDVDSNGAPYLDKCRLACANMLDYVLGRETDVAAVIAEPARAIPYLAPPGFWQQVRDACDRHGALLIFDEIPTGLGKTGHMFACDHDHVVPDIVVMGKALGGGILPIAAVATKPEYDVGRDWAFGHYTHEKNPVTARAALTTIEIIEDEDLVANAARVGELALDRLQTMRRNLPQIGDVRGRGLLIGIELVKDRANKEPDNDLAEAVLYACLDQGLSFKTSMGNVLTLTPPLIVSEGEMLHALDIIGNAIKTTADDGGRKS